MQERDIPQSAININDGLLPALSRVRRMRTRISYGTYKWTRLLNQNNILLNYFYKYVENLRRILDVRIYDQLAFSD